MKENFDFIVIGSGIAGLSYALEVAEYGSVAIITKLSPDESNTKYAQGGIATVFDKEDSFDLHIRDTIVAGDGLCKENVVEMVVKSGPSAIKKLVEYGVSFSKMSKNSIAEFDLGIEGGHSKRRIFHVQDLTGKEVLDVLLKKAKSHPNIKFFENTMAIDIQTKRKITRKMDEDDRCLGVYVLDRKNNKIYPFEGKITFLATGGAGKVYLYTSNPDIATGDGIAMAYRAGAKIANMEFFQFHPTCLYNPKAKSFLITEALRGEGAILRRVNGTPFMEKYHPLKDLAPRDIIARAIDEEMKKTGDDFVYLDATHLQSDFLKERFPNIYKKCLEFGIDITQEPIPVVPAAHYCCGGVLTDIYGETTIPFLFAAGETACTGLHGANRLASNSLLEALVFARRAAIRGIEYLKERSIPYDVEIPPWIVGFARRPDEGVVISQNWDELRRFMWNYVGIFRSNRRLIGARQRFDILWQEVQEFYWNYYLTPDLIELRNIASVAHLIIESAIYRKESRGLHYNVNHPYKDDVHFKHDTIVSKGMWGYK